MDVNHNWPFFITSVLFNSLLLISFITVFFFTYVSKVEKQVVDDQVTSLIQDLSREMSIVLTKDQEKQLRSYILTMQVDTSGDSEIEASNAQIRKKTYRMLGIIVCVGILTIIALVVGFRINTKELFISGLVSLGAVALTEFIFATFFAKNYKSLDENYVKLAIVNVLQQYIKND